MIRFFKKLFKRGDFMTRADKAYYKYRAKTIFWSAFCMIIIAWVGTNLVLCALTTDVKSNFDIGYEAAKTIVLPTGKDMNAMIRDVSSYSNATVGVMEEGRFVTAVTFDFYTSAGKYEKDGVDLISGLEAKQVIEGVDLYCTADNHVYILSQSKLLANEDCSYLFYDTYISNLELKNFDTTQTTNMAHMFEDFNYRTGAIYVEVPEVDVLDVSQLNTENVTDMSYMFNLCKAKEIIVSGFETANVTTMQGMFCDCTNLTTLDISSFDNSKLENVAQMFSSDRTMSLTTIYAGEKWGRMTASVGTDMFNGCANLQGSQGSKPSYRESWGMAIYSNIDASFAHIDGGAADPGYFTEKTA